MGCVLGVHIIVHQLEQILININQIRIGKYEVLSFFSYFFSKMTVLSE